MRLFTSVALVFCLLTGLSAQSPQLLYRFDEDGTGNPVNEGTSNPGPSVMIGLSTEGFSPDRSSCLRGLGGTGNLIYTGHYLNQGNAPWTIGFGLDTRVNDGAFQYLAGDGNFRIFTNGDTLFIRGPIPNVELPGASGSEAWTFVALTYDPVAGRLKGWINDEVVLDRAAGPFAFSSTIPFKLGGNSSSTNSMALGSQMENFRLYDRVISDDEMRAWGRETVSLPVNEKVMISEVYIGEPDAVELTNFSRDDVTFANWSVEWRTEGRLYVSQPLNFTLPAGRTTVLHEPSTLSNLSAGVWTQAAFQQISGNPAPISVALKDGFGNVLDEVRISGWGNSQSEGSLGGAFLGLALRETGHLSVERIWGQDSNSGRDWTSERQHSLGLESRSAGAFGTPYLTSWPKLVINEIDSNPDYIELYNRGTAPVNLQGWFLEVSATHGSNLSRVHPFPRELILNPNRYLVIGDGPNPPTEMPANVQYVDLTAVGGGNIPFIEREFTCALRNHRGILFDLVRTEHPSSAVWHNAPRAPAHSEDFVGAAPRGVLGGRILARNAVSQDTNSGEDWFAISTRSMGLPNVLLDGPAGRPSRLDVRLAPSYGDGSLSFIVDAGSARAGHDWGFMVSPGHLGGNGPILGLDFDAIDAWMAFDALGFFVPLDADGTTRVDVPAGTLPAGMQLDAVVFLIDGARRLSDYSGVLRFDG